MVVTLRSKVNLLGLFALLAPRFGGWRTSCLPAHKRHRQIFTDQDRADVAPVSLEGAAAPSVVAARRPLRARRAGAGDELEVEPARAQQIAKPVGSPVAQSAFGVALRSASFRCIEANQPNVGLLMVHPDRVAVYDAHLVGRDRRRPCYACTQSHSQEAAQYPMHRHGSNSVRAEVVVRRAQHDSAVDF